MIIKDEVLNPFVSQDEGETEAPEAPEAPETETPEAPEAPETPQAPEAPQETPPAETPGL